MPIRMRNEKLARTPVGKAPPQGNALKCVRGNGIAENREILVRECSVHKSILSLLCTSRQDRIPVSRVQQRSDLPPPFSPSGLQHVDPIATLLVPETQPVAQFNQGQAKDKERGQEDLDMITKRTTFLPPPKKHMQMPSHFHFHFSKPNNGCP